MVSVSGQVKEWVLDGYAEKLETDLPVTEINASAIHKIASGQELPAPVILSKENLPTEVIDNDEFGEFDPEEDGIDFLKAWKECLYRWTTQK